MRRHWRKRAQELRDEADRMREGRGKDAVLSLATTYDRLAEEAAAAEAAKASAEGGDAEAEMELQEGESLEELKARMSSLKPKKQTIPADLLNTANSYDDKVALIRMIVSDNSTRVASVLRHMIQPS